MRGELQGDVDLAAIAKGGGSFTEQGLLLVELKTRWGEVYLPSG